MIDEIRPAQPQDAPRLKEIALAAYVVYVERIGRELAPMTENRQLYARLGYQEFGFIVEDGFRRVLMEKRLAG